MRGPLCRVKWPPIHATRARSPSIPRHCLSCPSSSGKFCYATLGKSNCELDLKGRYHPNFHRCLMIGVTEGVYWFRIEELVTILNTGVENNGHPCHHAIYIVCRAAFAIASCDTIREPSVKVPCGAVHGTFMKVSTELARDTSSTSLLAGQNPDRYGRTALKWEQSSKGKQLDTSCGQMWRLARPPFLQCSSFIRRHSRSSGIHKRDQWRCVKIWWVARLTLKCSYYSTDYVVMVNAVGWPRGTLGTTSGGWASGLCRSFQHPTLVVSSYAALALCSLLLSEKSRNTTNSIATACQR